MHRFPIQRTPFQIRRVQTRDPILREPPILHPQRQLQIHDPPQRNPAQDHPLLQREPKQPEIRTSHHEAQFLKIRREGKPHETLRRRNHALCLYFPHHHNLREERQHRLSPDPLVHLPDLHESQGL